jgi:hypothetical protein
VGDLLEQAASWLADVRTAHLSHPVTYCRGDDSVEVAVTVGRTVFETDDGSGAVERFESRDFLIAASVLLLAGEPVEPQPGDKVKEPAGGKLVVYEVMAPGKEPCWRWSDPFRKTLRIHTKQTDEEDA